MSSRPYTLTIRPSSSVNIAVVPPASVSLDGYSVPMTPLPSMPRSAR